MPRDQGRGQITEVPSGFLWVFIFSYRKRPNRKKKKDMKLVREHSRVQADEGASNFILCSNVGKVF